MKKTALSKTIAAAALGILLLANLFSWNFSALSLMLLAGAFSLVLFLRQRKGGSA